MRGYRAYLVTGIVLLVIYLVAQYNKPVATNWTQTFSSKDKIPFGTLVLAERLTDVVPGSRVTESAQPVYNTLNSRRFRKTAYLIVAGSVELGKEDLSRLQQFAASGNSVFIATYNFGKTFSQAFGISQSFAFTAAAAKKGPAINFTNPALRRNAGFRFDKQIGRTYFRKLDSTRATVLGTDENNRANFLRYKIRKGFIYLLADPALLSNYQLLNADGADYAARSLSYLAGSHNVLLDTYYSIGIRHSSDTLRVFFSHEPLRYAYYLTISGLLLFVLFEVKRRQRIIPVADPLENSSVAFTKVVSSVYFHEGNHLDIAQKRLTALKEFLRARFFIDAKTLNAETLEHKTGARPATARLLFQRMQAVEQATTLTEGELLSFNEIIEQFYKQTRTTEWSRTNFNREQTWISWAMPLTGSGNPFRR
ncbi:DUF4350 domain-containing protein [Pedobacter yulinensis]|uniref:DUF4350 domain-containing protein n=1 Tax=Pedobacter yulinensis TaxID=2126353 RepID=A0A2T3HQR6_9SPHI|nr:DUF4350 domain-containing protein [Pedobacter yulinensis]PST84743.1 DUF4350 domain-containing protein [Pedobacter yulinensis]